MHGSGNNVSTLISDLRAYLELSRAAFSAPIGLSPTHIARLEKGVTVPSQENINRILNILSALTLNVCINPQCVH